MPCNKAMPQQAAQLSFDGCATTNSKVMLAREVGGHLIEHQAAEQDSSSQR